MRGILIVLIILLAVFVGVAVTSGWITFQQSDDKATIDIHTQEIERATDEAAGEVQEFIKESADSLKQGAESVQESFDNQREATFEPEPVTPSEEATPEPNK